MSSLVNGISEIFDFSNLIFYKLGKRFNVESIASINKINSIIASCMWERSACGFMRD